MFQDTPDGQTYFCEACEAQARNNRATTLHICSFVKALSPTQRKQLKNDVLMEEVIASDDLAKNNMPQNKCGCACHDPKYIDGLIHDTVCCENLNGSLEWEMVKKILDELPQIDFEKRHLRDIKY